MPEAVLGIALIAWVLGFCVICALKGRWDAAIVGVFIGIVAIVCACRLAKPGSFWARRWYDDDKMRRAEARFANSWTSRDYLRPPRLTEQEYPSKSLEPPLPNPQDSEPWLDEDPALQDRITRRARKREATEGRPT